MPRWRGSVVRYRVEVDQTHTYVVIVEAEAVEDAIAEAEKVALTNDARLIDTGFAVARDAQEILE
jgi:hypothetical protein